MGIVIICFLQTVRFGNARVCLGGLYQGTLLLDLRPTDQEFRLARRHDLVQYLLLLISCFISFLVSLQELK